MGRACPVLKDKAWTPGRTNERRSKNSGAQRRVFCLGSLPCTTPFRYFQNSAKFPLRRIPPLYHLARHVNGHGHVPENDNKPKQRKKQTVDARPFARAFCPARLPSSASRPPHTTSFSPNGPTPALTPPLFKQPNGHSHVPLVLPYGQTLREK